MELKDLSSNWKKLRKSFHEHQTQPSKRKSNEDPSGDRTKRRKHRRTNTGISKVGSDQKKMGYGSSKISEPGPSATLALWAKDNDITAKDLAAAYGASGHETLISNPKHDNPSINAGLSPDAEAGRYIAIDCEMVGVGPTPAIDSALARVSVVNFHGEQLYDSFVLPKEAVTDFRTSVSGITPQLLRWARTLEVVQADIAKLLNGRILVGHAIKHDLDALMLGHPKRDIRDTSRYPPFRELAKGRTPGLKRLSREILGIDIQSGEHSSVEDAQATMLLFRREKDGFEREHVKRWGRDRKLGNHAEDGSVKADKNRGRKKKVRK